MWASVTSSLSSLTSSLGDKVGGLRPRFYIPGGSLDREAHGQINYDNDPFLAGSGGFEEFQEPANRDLVSSVPGVLEVYGHLGSGNFGEVWECEVGGHQDRVAVKVFRPQHEAGPDRELQLHAELQHPNLVRLFRTVTGPPSAIFMEVCPGGSLARFVHDPSRRATYAKIPVAERVRAALDVVGCLEYLHANNVLHRDVKPSNCLLSSIYAADVQSIPQVKLGDLGLARHEAQEMSKAVGTLLYMAPELMEEDEYSSSVDIYSCAVLIYELCSGMLPYSTHDKRLQNYVAFILAVAKGERPRLDHLPGDAAGEAIRALLPSCWDPDPASRPTAAALAERLRAVPGVA